MLNYHGVMLRPVQYAALREVEYIIGEPIPNIPIFKPSKISEYQFGFYQQSGRIIGLFIANKNIREFPDSIMLLRQLKYFRCDNSNLYRLHWKVCRFPELIFLSARNNGMININDDIFMLENLEEFHADGNTIKTIPIELTTLRKLKILDLERNLIRALPEELSKLTNLEVLKLKQNKIADETIKTKSLKIFQKMKTLQTLTRDF